MSKRDRTTPRTTLAPMLVIASLLSACTSAPSSDTGSSDATDIAPQMEDTVITDAAAEITAADVPALDSGPPRRNVPANGWANAVTSSDIARDISEDGGTPIVNRAADPAVIIGPPEGTQAGAVALGESGRYVVVDMGVGEEVFDRAGEDVEVVEGAGIPENYRVLIATNPGGPFVSIGEGSGVRRFDLAGSGLASARYVRIESQRSADSILHGLGSAEYPGAEIDAVGALYPGGQE